MSLQDQRFQFFQCLAYRVGLPQDVDAVLVLFHHLANTRHVSLDIREAFEDLRFPIAFHSFYSFHPARPRADRTLSAMPTPGTGAGAANCSPPSPTRAPWPPLRRWG